MSRRRRKSALDDPKFRAKARQNIEKTFKQSKKTRSAVNKVRGFLGLEKLVDPKRKRKR